MKPYLIDTHGWIEYFLATEKGKKVQEIIQNENNTCFTAECTFAELKSWALRTKHAFDEVEKVVDSQSTALAIQRSDWLSAADLRHEMRKTRKDFGLIDAVILAKQQEHKCVLVSGDDDFKGLSNVVFLG